MNVLVDTSVWSLALRRKAHDLDTAERLRVEALGELIREGRAKLIGLVRQELLSGVKTVASSRNFVRFCPHFRMSPLAQRTMRRRPRRAMSPEQRELPCRL